MGRTRGGGGWALRALKERTRSQRHRVRSQSVEKPLGVRGPQPPEAIIGFGGVYGKSAKSLA